MHARAPCLIRHRAAVDVRGCRACFGSRLAPQRTLLLAFGHDEEVGGTRGARAIAGLLAAEGTQLEYVLDEGSPLLADGLAPFMTDRAVALVGTAEKVHNPDPANKRISWILMEVTSRDSRHAYAGG